jgi:hypothetical protein
MNIKKIIKEVVDEFSWVRDTNPITYKFFDIYVCFSYDGEVDNCEHGYSAFVKIPENIADEIWNGYIGYMGGPGDEGVGVIEWSIDNEQLDMEDVEAIDYVLEIDEDEYMRATGDPDLL